MRVLAEACQMCFCTVEQLISFIFIAFVLLVCLLKAKTLVIRHTFCYWPINLALNAITVKAANT